VCFAEFRGFRRKKQIPENEAKQEPEYKNGMHSSIWVPYAQGPSWSCALGKSGGGGTCARRGQCQSLAGGLAPTFKNNFAIPIECNDCCVRKEHSATCIDKGSQSNEGLWEAGHGVAFYAGWGQGSY